MVAYGRSKTANILFAVEFDRRHRARGIRATALHPGGIKTELGRHMQADELDKLVAQINAQLAQNGQPPYQWKTVPQGAATSVWAAFVAPADAVGAHYCENCQVSQTTDGFISPVSPGVRPYALDPRTRQGALGQERGDGPRALLRAVRKTFVCNSMAARRRGSHRAGRHRIADIVSNSLENLSEREDWRKQALGRFRPRGAACGTNETVRAWARATASDLALTLK